MKAEKLIYSMNDIRDEYVTEYAEKVKSVTTKALHHFRTWGIIAACLALVIICVPTLIHIYNPSEIDDPKSGEQYDFIVLEVKNAQLDNTEMNHSYDIDSVPIISVNDQKKGNKKTITFGNKQYDLEYNETITYVIGEVCVDEYVIIGNNNQDKVLLMPDGEIYAMLVSSIGQIDIDRTAEASAVRQAVEDYLKEEIDFGSFKYCDVTCSLPDISDGFGLYSFVWYNKIGDIITDQTLNLCVKQNGEINALWMKYNSKKGFEDVSDSITINDFNDEIKDKIKKIYGDNLIEYSVSSSVLTHYDGNIYLDCTIAVSYCSENTEAYSEACRLLIPID